MTSKFEIHISDARAYMSCKFLWYCQSPLHLHLEPQHTQWHFLTGRAVHYGMLRLYGYGENPAVVAEAYLRKAVEIESKLSGPLWEDEQKTFEEQVVLARTMCQNYLLWLGSLEAPDAEWEVIAPEINYHTPILTPSGRPSNRIELAGRFDQIIRHKGTNDLWLREFKTSNRWPDEEWLDFDDQAAGYCWAASQITGEPVVGIQYRFLLKKVPVKPRVVQGDRLSKAINSSLSTTYELYLEAIHENGYDPADYVDILKELRMRGWQDYFVEIPVRKTRAELDHVGRKFWTIGLEMTHKNVQIVDEPEWHKCVRCPFKVPCKVRKNGGNWMQVLENSFRLRQPEFELDDTIIYDGQEVTGNASG